MYLPKSQYKIIDQSELPGDVIALRDKDGEEIQSNKKVVLTALGFIFDTLGIDFDKGDFSKAKQLFVEESDEDFDRDTEENPTLSSDSIAPSLKLPPTSEERRKGIKERYFSNNKCTGKLKEISKVQSAKLARSRDKCIEIAKVDWVIKGPAKDQAVNGYIVEGVEKANQRSIEQLKKIMPGIEALIKSPLEYVQDTSIKSAKKIIPSDKDIVIPSPGKRL